MGRGLFLLVAVQLIPIGVAPAVPPAMVNFDALSAGTSFGASEGQIPGYLLPTQDAVIISLETFSLGSFNGFIEAQVGPDPDKPLLLDNISIRFDYLNVGFDVTQVEFDFQEFGVATGSHFSVNGFSPVVLLDFPTLVAPGVTAAQGRGSVILSGPIHVLEIGGQELAIDNIVAVPEPGTFVLLGLAAMALLRQKIMLSCQSADPEQ